MFLRTPIRFLSLSVKVFMMTQIHAQIELIDYLFGLIQLLIMAKPFYLYLLLQKLQEGLFGRVAAIHVLQVQGVIANN